MIPPASVVPPTAAVFALSRDPAVSEELNAVRSALRSVEVSHEAFFSYVAERLATETGEIDTALVLRNARDLYLACACSQGNAAAIAAFEDLYFADEVDVASRRSNTVPPDEMRQRVRAKLFVGPNPKIASYAGRSSLRTWLRAVVGRLVIDATRARPRDLPTSESTLREMPATGADPDRLLIQQTYQEALEEAFLQAAERLSEREKNLLRYGLSEGLNIDQIGRIYGVHRVTAARWLQKARAAFVEHVQAVMMERLKMSASEFESVLRLVLSQVDVTMARIFSGSEG